MFLPKKNAHVSLNLNPFARSYIRTPLVSVSFDSTCRTAGTLQPKLCHGKRCGCFGLAWRAWEAERWRGDGWKDGWQVSWLTDAWNLRNKFVVGKGQIIGHHTNKHFSPTAEWGVFAKYRFRMISGSVLGQLGRFWEGTGVSKVREPVGTMQRAMLREEWVHLWT